MVDKFDIATRKEIAKRAFGGESYKNLKGDYFGLSVMKFEIILQEYMESLKRNMDDIFNEGRFYEANLRPTSSYLDNFHKDHSDTIGGIALITVGHKDLHYKLTKNK